MYIWFVSKYLDMQLDKLNAIKVSIMLCCDVVKGRYFKVSHSVH